jgi:hypothetical protein
MKHLYLVILTSFCFSCGSPTDETSNGHRYRITPVDNTSNKLIEAENFTGVIFSNELFPSDRDFSLRPNGKPTEKKKVLPHQPTPEEVFEAERILKRCVEVDRVGADSMEIWEGAIYELSKYNRQYFGAINEKGQKLIWINCFYKSPHHENWKSHEVGVDDGGKAYFHITINLSTDQCYSFFRSPVGG